MFLLCYRVAKVSSNLSIQMCAFVLDPLIQSCFYLYESLSGAKVNFGMSDCSRALQIRRNCILVGIDFCE